MLSVKEDVIRVSYDWSRTNDKINRFSSLFLPRKTRRTAPPQTGRTFPPQRPRGLGTFPEALADVWDHSPENFPAHDHTRAPIQKFSPGSRASFPHFFRGAQSCLPKKEGSTTIQTLRKTLQTVSFDVNIIICSHKPFVFVQVVVMHVLEHHERLLLGRVGVVHAPRSGTTGIENDVSEPSLEKNSTFPGIVLDHVLELK